VVITKDVNRNWSWVKRLLYVVPFANIFNNRGGSSVLLGFIALCLVMIVFTSQRKKRFTPKERRVVKYGNLMLLSVLLMIFATVAFEIENYAYIRFFCLFIFLFPFLYRIYRPRYFFTKAFIPYLRYLIVLITASICIDFVLMSIGKLSWQPMYTEDAFSYYSRPFGLFGQPSVNSCLLCFFYLFHRAIVKRFRIRYPRDYYFFIVLVGCIVQGSGSGFLSLVIVLLCKYGTKRSINVQISKFIPYILLAFLVLLIVVLSNSVQKISLIYILELIEYTDTKLLKPYLFMANSFENVWFGIKDFPISIDFGPIFLMGCVGLFFFCVMTIFTCSLFRIAKSIEMKLSMVLFWVGNLHYPVMFYVVMHVLWFFILYYIVVFDSSRNEKSSNYNVCVQPKKRLFGSAD
jgi:hypothetical protein